MKRVVQSISLFTLTMFLISTTLYAGTIVRHGTDYRELTPDNYTYAENITVHDEGNDASAWDIYDNNPEGIVSSVQNNDNNIIKLQGEGTQTGYRRNFETPAVNTEFTKQWSMKYSERSFGSSA